MEDKGIRVCPGCGKNIKKNNIKFCPSCGREIYTPNLDKNWNLKVIAVIIAIVLFLFLLFYILKPVIYFNLDKV